MKNFYRMLPLILYLGLIFFISSRPNLKAPGPDFFLLDKLVHFMEYSLLGVLLFRGIGKAMIQSKFGTFVFLLAVGSSVGALDEIFQSYIPGRIMSIYDYLADTLGVTAGLIVAFLWNSHRRAGSKRSVNLHSEGG
jgi:VanZ family protein